MSDLSATGARLGPNERSIAAFTMLGHGLFHWFEMAIPILLVMWIRDFAAPVELVGVIVAIGFAPIGIAALPGGMLSDRYGPARVLLFSIGGMSIGFGTLALAPSIYAIGLSLAIWGIFAGIYHPGGMSLISTGATHRGTVFGYHGMAGNIGTALGPFAAATLLLVFEWQVVAALLAVPGVLAVLYGYSLDFDPTAAVDEDKAEAPPEQPVTGLSDTVRQLMRSLFPIVLLIVAFDGLFYRGVTTYLPQILRGLPELSAAAIGSSLVGINVGDYVFVGLLVVGIGGQWVGGKLSDRIRVEIGLASGFTILGVLGLIFVPVADLGLAHILVLSAVLGFFLFFVQPMYQVAVAVYTPPEMRGLSYGLTYLGEFGIGAASIAIGGYLLGAYSTQTFFLALSVFAFVPALLASGLARRSRSF